MLLAKYDNTEPIHNMSVGEMRRNIDYFEIEAIEHIPHCDRAKTFTATLCRFKCQFITLPIFLSLAQSTDETGICYLIKYAKALMFFYGNSLAFIRRSSFACETKLPLLTDVLSTHAHA